MLTTPQNILMGVVSGTHATNNFADNKIAMIHNIRAFIAQHQLINEKTKVVVGLSGGPDSVFLLHMLAQEQQRGRLHTLVAAHLDHEWRQDSSKDVQFCHEIAKKYNIRLIEAKLSQLPISLKFDGSKEEIGRQARRFFFEQVRQADQADVIALAHHAQDQQETFFIRLIRGATLTGLTGIKPKHGTYIRPLLTTNKVDMVQFLNQHQIPYLTDPSNESDEFLRNRLRKTVVPALHACDNRFDQKFQQTIISLSETENFLQKLTEQAFMEISTQHHNRTSIHIKSFFELEPVLRQRTLLYWLCQEKVRFPVSQGFFAETMKFLQQPRGGDHQLMPAWKIVKRKGMAQIIPLLT